MARPRRDRPRTFDCPHCGEPVRAGAPACRSCGSDLETGWSDEAELDLGSLPLGDEDFDYEAWLARELGEAEGGGDRAARRALRIRRVLAALVVLAMLLWLLARR